MFAHNMRMKSRRNTKIGRKVVCATADIPHQFQGKKVKVTRPLWVAIQVPTCRWWGSIVAAALQAIQLVVNYNI